MGRPWENSLAGIVDDDDDDDDFIIVFTCCVVVDRDCVAWRHSWSDRCFSESGGTLTTKLYHGFNQQVCCVFMNEIHKGFNLTFRFRGYLALACDSYEEAVAAFQAVTAIEPNNILFIIYIF